MKRSAVAVAICALLGALVASAPAAAHYSLPGGSKCAPIMLQPRTDRAAFDIKVKGISCRKAKPNIKTIARGDATGFDCEHRFRRSGDPQAGIGHSDSSCRKRSEGKRQRMVFAIT